MHFQVYQDLICCRYARADAAKRLLDAGAEANSQDNTGRTPLHAAVAADAMGVFQVSGVSIINFIKSLVFIIVSTIICLDFAKKPSYQFECSHA